MYQRIAFDSRRYDSWRPAAALISQPANVKRRNISRPQTPSRLSYWMLARGPKLLWTCRPWEDPKKQYPYYLLLSCRLQNPIEGGSPFWIRPGVWRLGARQLEVANIRGPQTVDASQLRWTVLQSVGLTS